MPHPQGVVPPPFDFIVYRMRMGAYAEQSRSRDFTPQALLGPPFTAGLRSARILVLVPFTGLLGVWLEPQYGTTMSRNYYTEIHSHMTWHTVLSQPLLTAKVEPLAIAHSSIGLLNACRRSVPFTGLHAAGVIRPAV